MRIHEAEGKLIWQCERLSWPRFVPQSMVLYIMHLPPPLKSAALRLLLLDMRTKGSALSSPLSHGRDDVLAAAQSPRGVVKIITR